MKTMISEKELYKDYTDMDFYTWHKRFIENGDFLKRYKFQELLERAYYAGADHNREVRIRGEISMELDDPNFRDKNPELFVSTGEEIEDEMRKKIQNLEKGS